jgi:hypothetical protein
MELEERKNTCMEVEAREPASSETNQQERDKKIRVMRKNFIDQGPWYDEEIIVAWE